jgi:hypothetical protein
MAKYGSSTLVRPIFKFSKRHIRSKDIDSTSKFYKAFFSQKDLYGRHKKNNGLAKFRVRFLSGLLKEKFFIEFFLFYGCKLLFYRNLKSVLKA